MEKAVDIAIPIDASPMRCNAGKSFMRSPSMRMHNVCVGVDSAPRHADRVEGNGVQAWRSCNGETRDEMRWRVGKDGKPAAAINQMHVSGATANVNVLTSTTDIFTTSKSAHL